MNSATPYVSQIIAKIASRCNLDCSYCYVYHKADSSWKHRPPLMSDDIFDQTLERVRRHCNLTRQHRIRLTFHGGEPCLIGVGTFDRWCARARQFLKGVAEIDLGIQTNGTLVDAEWADTFRRHGVDVGISIDGPKDIHDTFRIDHAGQGSYDRVERGLRHLQEANVSFGIMSVIPFNVEPLRIHRHFLSLGCKTLTYILPNFTHDTIQPIHALYGGTPCADFLLPIFDDWWFNGTLDVCIRDLWNMARIILGGDSEIETFGNTPPGYAFVETDGAIEGLDNLYVCKDGITKTGLNVRDADFWEMLQTESLHKTAIFEGMPLPRECRTCAERETCAGGYLPHRYSSARGFDNPSVWCADFLKLFAHLRERMGVTTAATQALRRELRGDGMVPSSERSEKTVVST